MDRANPQHPLEEIQKAFSSVENLRLTRTAQRTAIELGMQLFEIVEIIQSLKRANFYKSVTTLADHRVWQDVYRVPWRSLELYLKFMKDDGGLMIVSLKER